MTTLQQIPLAELHESPHNPRKHFDAGALEELKLSLLASGQITPITVRPSKNGKGGYEILAGHRRRRAAELAGLTHLDATVREVDDKVAIEILTIENLQRDDLHPLEEAQGFVSLMKSAGYDVPKIAARVGRSVQYVYDRIKLLQLTKEAQKLFLDGKFTAGHATLLARLSKDDQARALGSDHSGNGRIGGLFVPEQGTVDPRESLDESLALDDARKPVSVREFQGWIDRSVRFKPDEVDLPNLFPETAVKLEQAIEAEEKIVKITRDYRVPDDARDPKERTIGGASWKRADGTPEKGWDGKQVGGKPCEHAVLGVVVAGPGRGEAFKVCVEKKKCLVHWKTEQRESAARAKSGNGAGARDQDRKQHERYEAQRKAEDAERARWKKAMPALLAAVVEKLAVAPAGMDSPIAKALLRRHQHAKGGFTPKGKTADDVVRLLAFHEVAVDSLNEGRAPTNAPRELKLLGIDAQAIVDRIAPKPTPAKAEKPAVQPLGKPTKAKGKQLAGDVRRKRAAAKKKAAK